MLNRIIIGSLLIALSFSGIAQSAFGIGTDVPNASSIFESVATDRGILIPRISITDATAAAPVASPATSLLVYNTNAAILNGSGAGFYYWNGSRWMKLIDNAASDVDWYLENSTATPTAITDNIYTNGNVGIGLINPTYDLDVVGDIRVNGSSLPTGSSIYGGPTGSMFLRTNSGLSVDLEEDGGSGGYFRVRNNADQILFRVDHSGLTTIDGDLVFESNGNQIRFEGSSPVDIFTNTSDNNAALDIESQGGIDMVLDRDNSSGGATFTIKRNDDGTAAVNTLMSVPEDHAPLVYPYGTGTGETGGIRFRELQANGTSYIRLRAPDALSGSVNLTLPDNDGDSGELLMTDGTGNLSWYDKDDNIAIVKWQGTYNANPGGTITAAWSVAWLNVLEGATSFVSLATNRFTLQPGKYFISASVPAYQQGLNGRAYKSRLATSAGVVVAHGSFWNTTSSTQSAVSQINTILTVVSATTYQIEQYSLGGDMINYYPLISAMGDQVTTQVVIQKLD